MTSKTLAFSRAALIAGTVLAFAIPASAFAATLTVTSNTTDATYSSDLTNVADRLITLQNANGSWDYVVTSATLPTSDTYYNIAGVTAEGLLAAYNSTGEIKYLTAAENAGSYILTSATSTTGTDSGGSATDASTGRQNAYNIVFLNDLAKATGDSAYSAEANAIYNTTFTQSNYWTTSTGGTCTANGCTANELFASDEAYRLSPSDPTDGVVAWDLEPYVEAAVSAGDTSTAQALEQDIVNYVNVSSNSAYVNTISVSDYSLGLSSAVRAAIAVGDSSNESTLLAALDAAQSPTNGSFGSVSDGQVQATAYAVMALTAAKDSHAVAADSYLNSTIDSNGNGWAETGGVGEISEDDAEAAHALSLGLSADTLYSVQAAVNAASSGDTINVAAGTYPEAVSIGKPLTLEGAQAGVVGSAHSGTESKVEQMNITSKDVTIDGFSFTNVGTQVNVASTTTLSGVVLEDNIFSGYNSVGLVTDDAGNLNISNNLFENPAASTESIQIKDNTDSGGCTGTTVSDNVFTAATNNGGADVNFSCTARNTSTGVTVSGNTESGNSGGTSFVAFSGIAGNLNITNNKVTGSTGSALYFWGGVTGPVTVSGNTITGGTGNAVSIQNDPTNGGPNTGAIFTITGNNLSGDNRSLKIGGDANDPLSAGVSVVLNDNNVSGDTTDAVEDNSTSAVAVNAAQNYWGTASAPTVGTGASNIQGADSADVNFSPWYNNASMTTLAYTIVTTGATTTATTGTSAAMLTGTSTEDGGVNVTAIIPSGTTITGTSSWDGIIAPPTATSVTLNIPDTAVTSAITIGSTESDLIFSQAVQLTFAGEANQDVGWYNHAGTFTAITDICDTLSTPTTIDGGTPFPAGGSCKINSGSDLVVWTKHFSTFVTYVTPVSCSLSFNPTSEVSGGTSTLSWSCANTASTVTIDNGVGTEPSTGSVPVSLGTSGTYTYNLSTTEAASSTVPVTASATLTVTSSAGGGGGGGGGGSVSSSGGGGGGGSISPVTTTVTTPVPTTTTVTTTTTTNPGQVLGAAVFNFTSYLHKGEISPDVTALQEFLISAGFSIPEGPTDYFGAETFAAVKAYQQENGIPNTGYVGPLTIALLDKGEISTTPETTTPSNLTAAQSGSIIAVLESFGADAATIASVKAALGIN